VLPKGYNPVESHSFPTLSEEHFLNPASTNAISDVISKREREITSQWLELQAASTRRSSAAEKQEAIRESHDFIDALKKASQTEQVEDISGPGWNAMRDLLAGISARRAKGGYSPIETASFIFSLKEPLFSAVQNELGNNPEAFLAAVWQVTALLDKLGLYTMEMFQKTREDVISRQQQELMELSTPVVRLWDNILALPLIGTLDSARTQIVMQNLLDAIVQTRSDYAIIDITGVPVVDTLVAQHLLKTVAAARLMGADCLISGIRPQIAQTIIHLGVDLSEVTTKATLADAFAVALRRSGHSVIQNGKNPTQGAR
jgi:rsbT co-antagonist protein RsbR